MLSGGVAGVTTWCFCYPADFLKTRLQTAQPGDNRGVWKLASEIYREKGILSMYKGIHVQIIRAFPSNAVGLFIFEHAKVFLSKL